MLSDLEFGMLATTHIYPSCRRPKQWWFKGSSHLVDQFLAVAWPTCEWASSTVNGTIGRMQRGVTTFKTSRIWICGMKPPIGMWHVSNELTLWLLLTLFVAMTPLGIITTKSIADGQMVPKSVGGWNYWRDDNIAMFSCMLCTKVNTITSL